MSHPVSFARIVRGKQIILTMADSTVLAGFSVPGEVQKPDRQAWKWEFGAASPVPSRCSSNFPPLTVFLP